MPLRQPYFPFIVKQVKQISLIRAISFTLTAFYLLFQIHSILTNYQIHKDISLIFVFECFTMLMAIINAVMILKIPRQQFTRTNQQKTAQSVLRRQIVPWQISLMVQLNLSIILLIIVQCLEETRWMNISIIQFKLISLMYAIISLIMCKYLRKHFQKIKQLEFCLL